MASISTLKKTWLIIEFCLFVKNSTGAVKGKLRFISKKSLLDGELYLAMKFSLKGKW